MNERMTPKEVRAARAALGLTQRFFADDVGVSARQVRNWERLDGPGASRLGTARIRDLLDRARIVA